MREASMRKFTSPLEGVRVAAPCPADWEKMVGDERVRFCGQCSLHVYNLSGMTKREAEGLVANAEGRLCVRYYARADGSILTRNCPVGMRALKRRVSMIATALFSGALSFLTGVGVYHGVNHLGNDAPAQQRMMGVMRVMAPLRPEINSPPQVPHPQVMVGRLVPVKGA